MTRPRDERNNTAPKRSVFIRAIPLGLIIGFLAAIAGFLCLAGRTYPGDPLQFIGTALWPAAGGLLLAPRQLLFSIESRLGFPRPWTYWAICLVVQFLWYYALAVLWIWLRDQRQPIPGHCANCGYDLTGNVSGRCPECGNTVEAGSSEQAG